MRRRGGKGLDYFHQRLVFLLFTVTVTLVWDSRFMIGMGNDRRLLCAVCSAAGDPVPVLSPSLDPTGHVLSSWRHAMPCCQGIIAGK